MPTRSIAKSLWLLLSLLIAAAYSPMATAQCEGWVSGLQFPGGAGVDGTVNALVEWDTDGNGPLAPNVVAGGNFLSAGSTAATRVARWDGNAWHAMGSGLNGPVLSLAVYNNELYAGGAFNSSGSTSVLYIARWDGSAWQPVGAGFNGHVRAMCTYNGQLYAGGNFTESATGLPFNFVARWNGSTWAPVSVGLSGSTQALAVHAGELVAGGTFGVATWNGVSWQSLGDRVNFETRSLAVHNGVLIAGGGFTLSTVPQARNIAQLIDGIWQPVGSGFTGGDVSAVASYGNALIAGGDFHGTGGVPINRVARFVNDSWTTLGAGIEGGGIVRVQTILARQNELVAGGTFNLAGGDFSFNWARWTGDGTPPVITSQPEPVTIARGDSANFTVAADSNPGLPTYQWQRDGAPVMNGPGGAAAGGGYVTGAQMAHLTITNAQHADGGTYSCVITNECGPAESEGAALDVVCRADHDDNGVVAVPDIFSFLSDWFSGAFPAADFDGDGAVNVADIFAFLAVWFAGC